MENGADPFSPDWRRRSRLAQACVLVLFLLLLLNPSQSRSQTFVSRDSTLSGIKSLYDGGSYIEAELQARRQLEDRTVSDSARIQLEKYLAFSLVAQGKNHAAADHFIKALRIDSGFTLDPVLTSPKILTVFEAARSEFASQEKKNLSKEESNRPTERSLQQVEGPTFRAILFPGWDQLYRGRQTKGLILLTAGALTAVSAISFSYLRTRAEEKYLSATTPALATSRYADYNFFYKAQVYSISAFVLVYLYSEVDSFVHLPPYFRVNYQPQSGGGSLSLHFSF